jgi:hypothetical protein
MNAGYATGTGPAPDEELTVRVGGLRSTLRAEADGLLQLLSGLSEHPQALLLVFRENLVLLANCRSGKRQILTPKTATSSTLMLSSPSVILDVP